MYCPSCGNKTIENAAFCQKCGSKLVMDEAPNEPIAAIAPPLETQHQALATSASTGITEVHDLLKEGTSLCPKVKSVSLHKNGIVTIVKGTVYNYVAVTVNEQIKLGRGIATPFMVPLAIIGGFLAWIAASVGMNLADSSFYFEDYAILLAIGLFAIGLFLGVVTVLGNKESDTVLPYILKALEPRPVLVPTDKQRKQSYIITLIACLAIALIGAVIFGFTLLGDIWSGSESAATPYSSPSPVASNPANIILSQTYTNDAEGFSFNYQGKLFIEDTDLRNDISGCIIAFVNDTDEAFIAVSKFLDNGLYFKATSEDFSNELSLKYNSVWNVSLLDITIDGVQARKVKFTSEDDGYIATQISYIYRVSEYMYRIECFSAERNFTAYEPIFDAIMDSYTISNPASAQNLDVPPDSNSVLAAYNEIVISYGFEPITEDSDFNMDYSVEDIIGDSTPELLIWGNFYRNGADTEAIYGYKNGKAFKYRGATEILSPYKGEGNYCVSSNSGYYYGEYTIYAASDDFIAQVITFDWTLDTDNRKMLCNIDGKAVSENEYQDEIIKYTPHDLLGMKDILLESLEDTIGNADCIAVIRMASPYNDGITYGDVIDKYITSVVWNYDPNSQSEVMHITMTGELLTDDPNKDISIMFRVLWGDQVSVIADYCAYDDRFGATGFIDYMFQSYSFGFDYISGSQ